MRDLWLVVAVGVCILLALALQALLVGPTAMPDGSASRELADSPALDGGVPIAAPAASRLTERSDARRNHDLAAAAEPFDPAAEVEYTAHPEEHFQIIELLDDSGNTIADSSDLLLSSATPAAPEPALELQAEKLGLVQLAQTGALTGNDYEFPDMQGAESGGSPQRMIIPDQPIPGVSTRRLLRQGDGEIVARGTTVDLTYDMYSWSTGELVESSSLHDGGVLQVTLGSAERRIPAFVEQSIVGRPIGSRVQVVLGQGVSDLPDLLNPADGYVLVVDIARQGSG